MYSDAALLGLLPPEPAPRGASAVPENATVAGWAVPVNTFGGVIAISLILAGDGIASNGQSEGSDNSSSGEVEFHDD